MKAMRTPTRCCAVVFALLTVSTAPVLAGVNRWTSSGPVAGVNDVAIDPVDRNVVYAGTQKGIFKSSNGGLSWIDPSNGELDGTNVHCLAIDPLTPSSVYAGTDRGVLKSTNGGATWSDRRTAGAIYNLIFGSQKSTIYAADSDDFGYYYPGPSAVYKSTDDGEAWSRVAAGFSISPRTLVIDPTEPSTLYAGTLDFGGVYKSVDGGSTWRSHGIYGDAVRALVLDPLDPATLYASISGWASDGSSIFKSTDAGSTWRFLGGLTGLRALAINPRDPSTLYAATYLGVFRSTDGGVRWHEFNTGLTNRSIAALAIDWTGTRLHAGGAGGVFDFQISSGAVDLSVGSDNRTRLLLADIEGRLELQSTDRSGNSSSSGPFGPYDGWDPRAVADGSDGLTRVLWTNMDGSAALWLVGPEGNQASYRIGPVRGWTAVDVAASIAGSTRILWTDVEGRVALGTVGNAGDVSMGRSHGPYPGWTAVAIADGQDGSSRVLWRRFDGSAGLSFFGSEGLLASYRLGGAAGWTAADVAVGADGQSRILWTHRGGRIALWRVDGDGTPTARGPVYPPPPGFTANRISAGSDGLTRVLWAGPGGAILWIMSADNVFQESFPIAFGPPLPPPPSACPIEEGGLASCDPNGTLFEGTGVNNTSTVIGRVVGPGGVPIANAIVSTESGYSWSAHDWCHAETTTDAQGNFTLNATGVRPFDWGFFSLDVKVAAPVGTKTLYVEAWACPTSLGTIVLP
jgi:hypothetical protein